MKSLRKIEYWIHKNILGSMSGEERLVNGQRIMFTPFDLFCERVKNVFKKKDKIPTFTFTEVKDNEVWKLFSKWVTAIENSSKYTTSAYLLCDSCSEPMLFSKSSVDNNRTLESTCSNIHCKQYNKKLVDSDDSLCKATWTIDSSEK